MTIQPELGLKGTVGIVTGAASGIGRAAAVALASAGARVHIVDVNPAIETLAADLGGTFQVCDLAVRGEAREMVEGVAARGEGLRFLVNAAGVQAPRRPLRELEDEDWDRLSSCNLRAVMETCRAAAAAMSAGGSIVNVASISGTVGVPGIVAYGAIKAAVAQLSRGLAVELAPEDIRVNAVAPGYIRTAMTEQMLADPAAAAEVAARVPMGRVAEAEEVASSVLFLLSAWAGYVTGEVLHVDGGYRAQ
jgi:3-oxoacyl-[acyl-carrier protein] reductase